MKLLTSSQIRELDAYTIKQEAIDSVELMERASQAFVNWFTEKFDRNKKIKVFCGPGNNGGDGLAISRLLLGKGYKTETFIIAAEKYSLDFKINEDRLANLARINYIENKSDIPSQSSSEIIVDAIFGSGLSKPVEGIFAEAIKSINASGACIISVDIASGLFTNQHNAKGLIVQPAYTISFQLPKLSFFLPQNERYTGEWILADIGLHEQFIKDADSKFNFTQASDIKPLIKKRNKFSHKGNFGKALIIGGSHGMMGAIVLAAKACLRTGAGLSVTYVPQCGYDILQTALPENMVLTDPEYKFIVGVPELDTYNAIAVGPGLGRAKASVLPLKKLLEESKVTLVIDADALYALAQNKELLEKIPAGSILTPHPKEFERLAGKALNDYHQLELLKQFAIKIKSYVVLKGAYTAIATPEGEIHFNSTGNPGMATGGSGDVLTGIIVSLLAQGYTSFEASLLGVYLHGYAGDIAVKKISEPSLIASDIVEGIGEFYKEFGSSN
ncbi:MAG: NAD(P)H-hydrate dehydratase [Cytophagaceae bacterium]|nr:NAD(P)H-hydrate dehydratase [Cytophagaceae bacterium]